MKRLLPIGLVVLPALSLLVVVAVIVMLLSLNADVADLTRRLRSEAHTATDLHGQISTLREQLSAVQAAAPAAPAKAAQPDPPAEQPHAEATVVARPIKVTSSGGSPECFFKAGDSSGLVTCIKSEQARIAEFRAPGRYR